MDLHVGTLSKGFGCLGGFVACSRGWRDFLANAGRAQVYSTALPVPVVAAAHAALRVSQKVRGHLWGAGSASLGVCLFPPGTQSSTATPPGTAREPTPRFPGGPAAHPQEPWRRQHLQRLTRQLGAALGVAAQSPIVPIVLGPEAAAVGASMALLRRGFHVPAIRPPTVPRGTSRLRVSLSAAHSEDDVSDLVAAMRASGLQLPGLAAAGGQGLSAGLAASRL